jgi:hypothetical protein
MIRSPLVLFAAILLCSVEVRCEQVTAAKVCAVQGAIRWRVPAFTQATCERVAKSLNATRDPILTLAIAINESDLRPHIATQAAPGTWDVGLMGIRCHLEHGRCQNAEVKWQTLDILMDPATNIEVGARILESKRASHGEAFLRGYNGGTKGTAYADRIGAIVAALGGEAVRVKGKRMRELVRKIVGAIRGGNS